MSKRSKNDDSGNTSESMDNKEATIVERGNVSGEIVQNEQTEVQEIEQQVQEVQEVDQQKASNVERANVSEEIIQNDQQMQLPLPFKKRLKMR
jgi:hypothetical protein